MLPQPQIFFKKVQNFPRVVSLLFLTRKCKFPGGALNQCKVGIYKISAATPFHVKNSLFLEQIVNIDGVPGAVGFTSVLFPFVYPVRLIRVNEFGDVVRDENGLCILCKPGEPGEFGK